MNRVATIRALIVPMPGMTEAAQLKAVEAAGKVVAYSQSEQSAWMKALRPGQVGWVWRLSWLAPYETKAGPRPIAEYARIISDLSVRIGEGAIVIQGDQQVCSDDRKAWLKAVYDGANQVRSGLRTTPEEYARRGEGGRQWMVEHAALNKLRTTHKAKLPLVRRLWSSDGTRKQRADAINVEMEAAGLSRLGSWQTIWRALKELEEI